MLKEEEIFKQTEGCVAKMRAKRQQKRERHTKI